MLPIRTLMWATSVRCGFNTWGEMRIVYEQPKFRIILARILMCCF
jgi:hypothetical protein